MFRRKFLGKGVVPAVCIALATLMVNAGTARAGSLREALAPLAEQVKFVVVDDQKQSAIQIGEFSGNGHANCGPGLCEDLKLALNGLQAGICQEKAPLKLKGEYDQIQDPKASHLTILQVAITIRDVNGRKVAEKSIEVRDNGLIAAAGGITVSLPAKANRDERNDKIQKAIEKPTYYAQDTVVRTHADSPFGVEVLVTSLANAPHDVAGWNRIPARAPTSHNGEAYVQIDQNEVYALRLHNRHRLEAAARITIDGVDVFTFSDIKNKEGLPRFKNFIITPGVGIVPGWHRTNEYADSFLVTEYGKGAASKVGLKARGSVGVISVRFALAWVGPTPAEEAGARDGGKETGFGPPVRVAQKEVHRQIGVDRDVISIRYNR